MREELLRIVNTLMNTDKQVLGMLKLSLCMGDVCHY